MRRNRFDRGSLLVLGAAILWGTTGTTQAFAPASASPISIGAVRLLIGGVTLLVFAGAQGLLPQVRHIPRLPWLISALAMALYQLTFFQGVRATGVAAGTIVTIGSAPVFAGLLTALVLRQMPGIRWLLATALAIAGCVLLVASGGSVRVEPVGILLALAAGACYALYAFFTARILAQGITSDLAAAATFALGALLLLPVLLKTDLTWLLHARGVLAALQLGLVATAAAYILFTRGLRLIPLSSAVTLTLGEPIVASLLGVIVVGERLAAAGWLGVGMVFAALLMLTIAPRERIS